jgi:hypothetical protein
MQPHRLYKLMARTAVGLTIAGAPLYLAAGSLGASGQAPGAIKVFIAPSLTGRGGGKILVTGAIGDYGISNKVNAAGQPDLKGTYSDARLHHGSILLNTTALKQKIQIAQNHSHPNLATCTMQGSVTGNVPIVSGTGRYAGISGNIHTTFTFAELGTDHTSGPNKGKCDEATGPVAQWAEIVGAGTVSFK